MARDRTAAFMFGYNLLGRGYVYADPRNVCSSPGEEAAAAFVDAYGLFDPAEIAVDDVVSALVHFACQRPSFPSWADADH